MPLFQFRRNQMCLSVHSPEPALKGEEVKGGVVGRGALDGNFHANFQDQENETLKDGLDDLTIYTS